MADARVKAYGFSLAIFLLDRASKWIIESRVGLQDTIPVIPGFFDIVHSRNRGVAFSILHESTAPWRTGLLVAASVAAAVLVSSMLWRAARLDRLTAAALSLILGGTLGNAFDRIAWGAVTDFLDFYIGDLHWPAFNVADSAVVVGCCLLVIELLKPKRVAART